MLNDYAIDNILKFEPGQGGLTRAIINTDTVRGEIYLHGAHITAWQPHNTDPVMFLSSSAIFAEDKPIRGGVPICFPWFGPHPADPDAPAHGLVRTCAWELVRTDSQNSGVTLELSTHCRELDVTLTVTFAQTLTMALSTTNRSSEEQIISEALHTYLAIDDVRQVHITGLKDVTYHSKVENGRFVQQDGDIRFISETDRVYLNTTDTVTLHDPNQKRNIIVEKFGSRSTVIWNPWEDKARSMSDLTTDQWPQFVCIETANALDDAVTLKPNASHTITAALRVDVNV